jgi:hypothetical protein
MIHIFIAGTLLGMAVYATLLFIITSIALYGNVDIDKERTGSWNSIAFVLSGVLWAAVYLLYNMPWK